MLARRELPQNGGRTRHLLGRIPTTGTSATAGAAFDEREVATIILVAIVLTLLVLRESFLLFLRYRDSSVANTHCVELKVVLSDST